MYRFHGKIINSLYKSTEKLCRAEFPANIGKLYMESCGTGGTPIGWSLSPVATPPVPIHCCPRQKTCTDGCPVAPALRPVDNARINSSGGLLPALRYRLYNLKWNCNAVQRPLVERSWKHPDWLVQIDGETLVINTYFCGCPYAQIVLSALGGGTSSRDTSSIFHIQAGWNYGKCSL